MIYGLGVDVTEIQRIAAAVAHNPRFANKVLTPAELAVYEQYEGQRRWEYLAGRFSAKESYSKAYGTGLGRVALQDVSILDNKQGKPVIVAQPYGGRALVSISHTATLVFTEVILEEK